MWRTLNGLSFRGRTVLVILVAAEASVGAPRLTAQYVLSELPQVSVRQVTRLGSFDDPVVGFSIIGDIALGPAGGYWVLLPQEQAVRGITADGDLLGEIGGRGAGPGEFENPRGLGWRGDTLWVMDPALSRVSYFVGGDFVDSHSYRFVTPTDRSVAGMVPLRGDSLLAVVVPQRPEAGGFRVWLTPVNQNGQFGDPLAALEENVPRWITVGTARMSTLHSDFPLHRVRPDGSAIAVLRREIPEHAVASLDLRVMTPQGEPIFRTGIEVPGTPLPQAELEEMLDARLMAWGAGDPNLDLATYRRRVPRPTAWAPANQMVFGTDGWVWIELASQSTAAVANWVVIDSEGVPRFVTELPKGFRGYAGDRRKIIGVRTDHYEMPYVETYQLTTHSDER